MGKRETAKKFARRDNGFYPTPREAFLPLLPHLLKIRTVEPCAGDGTLSALLEDAGAAVVAQYDIAPQNWTVESRDARFLTELDLFGAQQSVTNPPWPEPRSNGEPTLSVINNMRSMVDGWWLLPADFAHNVYAAELMRHCHKIVSVGRVKWIKGSQFTGMENCCWYYFSSEPASVLTFIPNGGRVFSSPVVPDPLVAESLLRRASCQPYPQDA